MAEQTVYLVEDDQAVRDAISLLLAMTGRRVAAFASGEAFLAAIDPAAAGCVILDHRLPRMSGLELLAAMTSAGLSLPVVMVTGHGTIPTAVAAFKGGAIDFIEKPFREDDLLQAVDRALERDRILNRDRTAAADARTRIGRLTEREREVMLLVAHGLPNKLVADRLAISVRTVETHRARVMEKMEAASLSELVRMVALAGGTG